MVYSPNFPSIYCAAMGGALSGMSASNRLPSSDDVESYANPAAVAGAFAEALDGAWGNSPEPTSYDIGAVQSICESVWQNRAPTQGILPLTNPLTYEIECAALVAIISAGRAYIEDQSITPPPAGGLTGPSSSAMQMVYVNKGGSDAEGDGTYLKPYLTVQAAINSIGDATSAKRYKVKVGPGEYAENLTYKPWVWVEGVGSNREVIFSGATAPAFGAAWADVSETFGGLSNVTITKAYIWDLKTLASNSPRFILNKVRFTVEFGEWNQFKGYWTGFGVGTGWVLNECEFPNLAANGSESNGVFLCAGGYFTLINCTFGASDTFTDGNRGVIDVRSTEDGEYTWCSTYGCEGALQYTVTNYGGFSSQCTLVVQGNCSVGSGLGGFVSLDAQNFGANTVVAKFESTAMPFTYGFRPSFDGISPAFKTVMLLNGANEDCLLPLTDAASLSYTYSNPYQSASTYWTAGTKANITVNDAITALAQAVYALRGNVAIPLPNL